ncbi:MurR/RpiR family transcriptional regulator [Bordetella sp. N]|uniref:MurR/RpiR family transcriptional regulator n=1 Tax=Bordetella sp. N TaxID=1746199 RepID=UPI0009E95F50|nr:MurR/RpiR family transcriptional regulator [Bordetella sp. N]
MSDSLDDRIAEHSRRMTPAEKRVADFMQANREEVMVSSAATIATQANTSDATVIRTTQALGYSGLDELRQTLAAEMRGARSLPDRLSKTVKELGAQPDAAFQRSVEVHLDALASLGKHVSGADFKQAVELLAVSSRVVLFGLGPSGAIAQYFGIQLNRFGYQTLNVGHTGLLFADDLHALRAGDVVVMLAYDRLYKELDLLLAEAARLQLNSILITDSLKGKLQRRVTLALSVPRGKARLLSMHTATMGLLEALLVGVATQASARIGTSLDRLNALREKLVS